MNNERKGDNSIMSNGEIHNTHQVRILTLCLMLLLFTAFSSVFVQSVFAAEPSGEISGGYSAWELMNRGS